MKLVKTLGAIIYCLFFGFYGLIFGFADLGPSETHITRALLSIAYFVVIGALLGFFAPKRWKLGLLIGWSQLFIILMIFFRGIQYPFENTAMSDIITALLNIAAVVAASYLVHLLRHKKVKPANE